MKKKIILDFDSTMCHSISAFCSVYSVLYKHMEGFKEPNPDNVKVYSLMDECPLVDAPVNIFNTKLFFEFLKPFPNAEEVVEKLSKQFDIYVVSICQPQNAYYKEEYIREHFPTVKQFIPIINTDGNCDMGCKGEIINANNSICVDDSVLNLESFTKNTLLNGISTCYNIIYGKEYHWNKDNPNNYFRANNWNELYNHIIEISS
jgi:5'(3')-deoxyribonucleotidase